ncbi:MAG: EpsI family protein [Desulfobacterales bacterium]|nr:EpsI family protein [Desulfobacterales bacterium]
MHYRKIIILVICFTLTSILIYWQPSSKAVQKNTPLSQALSDIKGWKSDGATPMDPRIVDSLELDDYVNQTYSNGNNTVSLYIGYYLTTKKVGAAHDPLVCFPGQGWVLSSIKKGELNLNPEPGGAISYSTMIAQRSTEKQLIIYWFQSCDKTNSNTLSQKIASLWKKISGQGEDNAFVRVSIPIKTQSKQKAFIAGTNFIKAFYPVFLKYKKF